MLIITVIGLGAPEAECREQLIAINSELCLAESAVGQLREHLIIQRKELETAKVWALPYSLKTHTLQ